MKAVYLNEEEIEEVTKLLNYEIESNEDYIKNPKLEYDEKLAWEQTIELHNQIKEKLRINPKIEKNLVIQELTHEQEDYIIESGLEQIRENRQNE